MQEAAIPVPNVVGMNAPQAAAVLNRVGLRLGTQANTGWSADSGLAQNTIGTQSLPPDQAAAPGTAVDVTVLRSPNIALIYDENDITLSNNTGADLNLNGLSFGVAEGAAPGAFTATRWTGALAPGGCAQLWSVLRSAPKDVEGCARINHWLTSVNNTAEHFWTALNGVVSFNIVQNGVQYATCPAAAAGAQPMRCEAYLPLGAAVEVTPYIYFAYTPERLIVFNRSQDKWMPIDSTPVINLNPNLSIPEPQINLSDPTLVGAINPVANIALLAPNQCLLFTNNTSLEVPNLPEPCDAIGQGNIDPNLIFWSAAFDVVSVTDGQRHRCAAATAGRLTICVMPR
jgi:hypothetical protein